MLLVLTIFVMLFIFRIAWPITAPSNPQPFFPLFPLPLSVKQIRFHCGPVMRRLLCSADSYLY